MPRVTDLGITIGLLPPGPTGSVLDVPGTGLGHATVWRDEAPPPAGRGIARTGVTVLDPGGDLFASPVPAGAAVLNGAGAAAVMKVVFALKNKTLPPQANFRAPATGLALAGSPFRIPTTAEPWPERAVNRPRKAAVSGFGFGGVNAHLLFEEFVAPVHGKAAAERPTSADAGPIAVVGAHMESVGQSTSAVHGVRSP